MPIGVVREVADLSGLDLEAFDARIEALRAYSAGDRAGGGDDAI